MTDSDFSLTSETTADGGRRLQLRGRLTLAQGTELWRSFAEAIEPARALVVDLSGVHRLDGGVAAMLVALREAARAQGSTMELTGVPADAARMLDLYAAPAKADQLHPRIGTLAQIGDFAHDVIEEGKRTMAFLGDLAVGIVRAVQRPRSVNFGDIGHLMERAGADGLPIVLLLNFLIGLVLGLQGAVLLHRFGADQFLANLVGLSVVRELAPLMTAILVAGRSGAAYAAELGSMSVDDEIDALRTLGLDPIRWLVFPRCLALFVVVPLLTVLGDIVGCLGGLFIATTYLQLTPASYFTALRAILDLADVGTGLIKSGFFAVLIAMVACQRGLGARGGAVGVGNSTTSAVVVVLFGLVALDTVFAWIFSMLGW